MTTSPSINVSDLAGCQVLTDRGECLGVVADVLPSGGHDIFVVHQGTKEILIPALKEIIRSIDLGQKRVDVVLPAGLREIYENA